MTVPTLVAAAADEDPCREAWLSVALAVAQGLPQPTGLTVWPDEGVRVNIDFRDREPDAHRWVVALSLQRSEHAPIPSADAQRTVTWWAANRGGVAWTLVTSVPVVPDPPRSPLAARVAAAILEPDRMVQGGPFADLTPGSAA